MNIRVADDKYLGKLSRQFDDLSRLVKQGTLDPEMVSTAVQKIIEGRFNPSFPYDPDKNIFITDHALYGMFNPTNLTLDKGIALIEDVELEITSEFEGREALRLQVHFNGNTPSFAFEDYLAINVIPPAWVELSERAVIANLEFYTDCVSAVLNCASRMEVRLDRFDKMLSFTLFFRDYTSEVKIPLHALKDYFKILATLAPDPLKAGSYEEFKKISDQAMEEQLLELDG